jgi:TonB family protein
MAQFSAEALKSTLQGTVILELTIDQDGRPRDIKVRVGLPCGLTQQAVEAVKEWKFKPSTGPDGKPEAVRQAVEITFHH